MHYAQKSKSGKSKMAADAIIFCVIRYHVLVKPVGRFWRVIRQNACFDKRRCLLGFRMIKNFSLHPQNRQNSNFCALTMHFLWKTKKTNNFRTVSPIVTKFGMQSPMRTPKSAVCSKIKKINENQRWSSTP